MEIQLWMSITVWVLCELQVYWSAGGAKNVFWPWLSLLRRWGSLTMIFLGIFGFTKKYIRGHKWFTTHRVLKSHRSKMSIIYILSWKQCALPVSTTMALWQLMHLGTWCTVPHCWYQWSRVLKHSLSIYIALYIYVCVYI